MVTVGWDNWQEDWEIYSLILIYYIVVFWNVQWVQGLYLEEYLNSR